MVALQEQGCLPLSWDILSPLKSMTTDWWTDWHLNQKNIPLHSYLWFLSVFTFLALLKQRRTSAERFFSSIGFRYVRASFSMLHPSDDQINPRPGKPAFKASDWSPHVEPGPAAQNHGRHEHTTTATNWTQFTFIGGELTSLLCHWKKHPESYSQSCHL